MSMRNQLLGYFLSLILAIFTLFGWNTYFYTQETIGQTGLNLGTTHLGHYSDMLSDEYRQTASLERLQKHLHPNGHTNDMLIFLTAGDFRPILKPNTSDIDKILVTEWQKTKDARETSGSFQFKDQEYFWFRSPIEGSPYSAVMLQLNTASSAGLMKTLGSRLLSISLLVFWIAVWVALLLSTLVSKRLAQQQKRMVHIASHDRLTGLPNRHQTHELLNQAIKNASEKNESVACIMVDLNRFKEINDALGHELGDRLLQLVAERLRNTVWENDTVTRIGGDEFAIILNMTNEDHINTVVNKIVDLSDEPLMLDHSPLSIETTLGVATYPRDGGDTDTLIRKAEVAMYSARKTGMPFDYYRAEYDPKSRQRLQLTSDLRGADERAELDLYFQPKISIRSGNIVGAEALCRWNHPSKGNIPPGVFIPVAEQTGIIWPITMWVLDNSLQQCAQWVKEGLDIPVSVNISARLLHDINLPGRIAQALKTTGFPAKKLELEITETALMIDPVRAVEVLDLLHDMGVKVSLDDFGSGYMSLSYLRTMPVDDIKIDMSFIRNMLANDDDGMIVNTIIDLGHNLGCRVTAEGVENRETYDALSRLKCDTVQGYYISRPQPAADFALWLNRFKQTSSVHDFVAANQA